MVEDENLCLHCRLCAEDVQQEHGIYKSLYQKLRCVRGEIKSVNDFVIKFANVNGSGS